jgi:hypothetical protein
MTSPVPTSDPAFPTEMLGLAASVCAEYYRLYPDTDERYGGRGRAYCSHDNAYLAAWIINAVALGSPAILARDVQWLADLLAARDFPMDRFVRNLELVAAAVAANGLAPAPAVEAIVRPVADAIVGTSDR